MDLELTPEQRQLEKEVYAYFHNRVTPELEKERETLPEGDGPLCMEFVRQLGRDGWMGIGWPQEYGGQGRSPIEQYIFFDLALGYFRVTIPMLALMTVGPTLMKVGTEEQKKKFLPPILRGELSIAIAYTEPEAGTDLFSLKTMAVRDGDDYVINGQKIFTSMGHCCDYFWLAVRTDPDISKKHRGISIFMVDAKSPGITIEPMQLMGHFRSNQEFFDNVRVPKESLVGQENRGLDYMIMQLAHERISLVPHSMAQCAIDETTEWARTTRANGTTVMEQPWVRNKLAEMVVETEVLKLLNYRLAWLMAQGVSPHVESAMIKAFGSELFQRVHSGCLQTMGLFGQLQIGSKWAPAGGWVARVTEMVLMLTFGGGTNEVMKDMMAMMGLGQMKSR